MLRRSEVLRSQLPLAAAILARWRDAASMSLKRVDARSLPQYAWQAVISLSAWCTAQTLQATLWQLGASSNTAIIPATRPIVQS